MTPFLLSITLFTWITIVTLILSLIVYLFKLDKKIIFYYAKKNKAWAIRNVYRLQEELEQRKLKDKNKRKSAAIKRADELSAAHNGKRFYVMQVYEDFAVVDSTYGKKWLKDNGFNSKIVLAEKAIYYTPVSNLCVDNDKRSMANHWFDEWMDGAEMLFRRMRLIK
jgi:hypothetical protein